MTYNPNALGQPTQVASSTQTLASGISYFPNGALKQFTYGNGIVHTLTQNARGLPAISRDASSTVVAHHDEFAYDQNGNVVAIIDGASGNNGDRDMEYDDLNRLTSAVSPMFGTATYAYDVRDNLTHAKVTGGSQSRDWGYVYDTTNRLTNITSAGISVIGLGYDVQGNLINKNGALYGFDYGNRLRSGGAETYRYDAWGRRARSINSSGGILYSLYGRDGNLLWQRDERKSLRRNYVYLQGSLLAEHRRPIGDTTETIIYQHTDALGSPVATSGSAGTVLQRSEYEPYGYQLTPALTDGPGYTGHAVDAATGLVYMQQRYYDPVIGRFLSSDATTAYSSGNAAYFVRYAYAFNNPYGFIDPDGRYNCTHNGATCTEGEAKRMEGYVQSMRKAQEGMKPGAAADRLGKIVEAIGTAWDGNGVSLNFASLEDGVSGRQDGNTLNIDESQIKGDAAESKQSGKLDAIVGSTIAHEGSHLIDSRQPQYKGNSYPTSRNERLQSEIRAFGVGSAIDKLFGIRSDVNAAGMSVGDRSDAILNAAENDVAKTCARGGYACN